MVNEKSNPTSFEGLIKKSLIQPILSFLIKQKPKDKEKTSTDPPPPGVSKSLNAAASSSTGRVSLYGPNSVKNRIIDLPPVMDEAFMKQQPESADYTSTSSGMPYYKTLGSGPSFRSHYSKHHCHRDKITKSYPHRMIIDGLHFSPPTTPQSEKDPNSPAWLYL